MATNYNDKYVDYLQLPKLLWKRPEGPLKVWHVFEGRKKTADGKVAKFSIQEVPEELYEDVVDHMEKYFLAGEPISVYQNLSSDPVGVREFRTLWRVTLEQGLSVIALKVNSDPNAKPVIAGVNVLRCMTPELEVLVKKTINRKSEKLKKMVAALRAATYGDLWSKFGVDKYIDGIGLSVHPDFRGLGLAEELLRTRTDIGRAYQISLTETVFTGAGSQIAAARAGFELLNEKKFSEILGSDGTVAFPGIPVEYIKAMAKKLY